ncbi:unnamed protein product [Triticum turgidum subsp. durum]|uniref:AB hydrolase-1 domain-containing protein n=1 Tax=Triticum turgidum subsp. durum TaxID=4567 RepID=A0A9R1BY84_TRITD|nr:unnamed protein product [Triticum turgidum subsp. durum]
MASDGVITHRSIEVNRVRLHVAEAGPAGAPVVLLLHGFPELWYTWRHQMPALAAAGYRAVAPDMPGYGDSEVPSGGPDQYTALHIVGDLVALIDSLGQERVFVVAHDWGAIIAWSLCQFRPDRVKALVALSVPFTPRDPAVKPVDGFRALYGDDFYICSFQEPGAMEAEFKRLGTELVLRKFFVDRTAGPLFIPKSGWGSPDDEVPLPSWFTEEDVKTWELTSPWTGAEIMVPTKFIVGDLDLTYNIAGAKDFINKGGLKKFVPLLDGVVIMKDVGHFINEEKPDEISALIISFIKKFN